MRSTLPTTIEIKQNIAVKNDLILADATQFHQILMNLCTNAGYAMKKEGGVLDVRLEEVSLKKEDLITYPSLKIGPYLKLTVKDTGCGIPEDNLERIFDPYFTSKGKGEGTGLGLAVTHGIIKDYEGAIKVFSEVGKGTTFNVLFPGIEKRKEINQKNNDETLPSGTETILFVDDEETLVRIGKMTLEKLGYKVITATDAEEAVETFELAAQLYDLIITDKNMPKMDGFQLAERIKKVRPDIPIIMISGFAEKEEGSRFVEVGINGFLLKPVQKQKLAKMVRSVLDVKAEMPEGEEI